MTHPCAGNIGGGGFMIVRTAAGEVTTFDYREKAPLKSTRTMYLGADGKIDRSLTAAGYLAPGVPGTVRGLELAHKRFGKLPWKAGRHAGGRSGGRRIRPVGVARPRAEPRVAGQHGASSRRRSQRTASRAAATWAPGDRLVLGDLAKTLRAIADDGAEAFYTGWIADRIADDMKANGGLITKDDLAAYQAKERQPVRGTYRGYEIVSMPPPSSGGVALIEMLNILEPFDLKEKGLLTAPAIHLEIEAMRRAYLDRARHLGDPDFVSVPVAELTSKEHAQNGRARRSALTRPRAASSWARTSSPPKHPEPDETTHFSVIDRAGMAVTSTYTLEGGFGSHVVVKGAGFLLNNEMGDFNKKPGETNAYGRHRHAGEPDRSRQADAQLDDADDRPQGREGRARHRLARRADDHQHRSQRRARGDGVRAHGTRRRSMPRGSTISGCRIA